MTQQTTTHQMNNKGEAISRIINRVLTRVFGKEASQLIYKYLETRYSLKPDEVANKIDIFARGLEEFLDSGAYVIERQILEDIYSSYGLLRRLQLEKIRDEDGFVGQVRMLANKT